MIFLTVLNGMKLPSAKNKLPFGFMRLSVPDITSCNVLGKDGYHPQGANAWVCLFMVIILCYIISASLCGTQFCF